MCTLWQNVMCDLKDVKIGEEIIKRVLPQIHNIGIQINRNTLTKTFMKILNLRNTLVSMFYRKEFSAVRVQGYNEPIDL